MKRQEIAFTLIELLIVVAIIAILAAIAVPNFLEAQTRSKVSRAKSDMRTLATAAQAYTVDFNRPPHNINVFSPVVPRPFRDALVLLSTPIAYLTDSQPIDPFGNKSWLGTEFGGQYPYYYFSLFPNEPLITAAFSSGLALTQEELELISSHQFAFFSTGPDQMMEFEKVTDPLASFRVQAEVFLEGSGLYDPTNGTISDGDIILSGKGILESTTQ